MSTSPSTPLSTTTYSPKDLLAVYSALKADGALKIDPAAALLNSSRASTLKDPTSMPLFKEENEDTEKDNQNNDNLSSQWFYTDLQGVQQGPFDGTLMQQWYLQGLFSPSLSVRRDKDTVWTTVSELWTKCAALPSYDPLLAPFAMPLPPAAPPTVPAFPPMPKLASFNSSSSIFANNGSSVTTPAAVATPLESRSNSSYNYMSVNPSMNMASLNSFNTPLLNNMFMGDMNLNMNMNMNMDMNMHSNMNTNINTNMNSNMNSNMNINMLDMSNLNYPLDPIIDPMLMNSSINSINTMNSFTNDTLPNLNFNVDNLISPEPKPEPKSEPKSESKPAPAPAPAPKSKSPLTDSLEEHMNALKLDNEKKLQIEKENALAAAAAAAAEEKAAEETRLKKEEEVRLKAEKERLEREKARLVEVERLLKEEKEKGRLLEKQKERLIEEANAAGASASTAPATPKPIKSVAAPWASVSKSINPSKTFEEIQQEEKLKKQRELEQRRKMEEADRLLATKLAYEDSIIPTINVNNKKKIVSIAELTSNDPSNKLPSNSTWAVNNKSTSIPLKSIDEIKLEELENARKYKQLQQAEKTQRTIAETIANNNINSIETPSNSWTVVSKKDLKPKTSTPATPTIPTSTPLVKTTSSSVKYTAPSVPSISTTTSSTSSKSFPPMAVEFLSWCRTQLAGLYPTVNKEDVLTIMMQLPSGSESSEIIADTIYSNSSTMDGRRFATEFMKKRNRIEDTIKRRDWAFDWFDAIEGTKNLPINNNAVSVDNDNWDGAFTVVRKKGRKGN